MEGPLKQYPFAIKALVCGLTYTVSLGTSYAQFELLSIHQSLSTYFSEENGTSGAQFEMYYDLIISLQSLATIVGSLSLGYVTDKFGYQKVLLINSILIIIGQIAQYAAYFQACLAFLICGRMLTTIANTTMAMPLGRLLRKYFEPEGKFAFFNAMLVASWIFGCILNSFIAPNLILVFGLLKAELVPMLIAICSALLLIVLYLYDSNQEAILVEDELEIKQLVYYTEKLTHHKFLFLSLMVQKGVLSLFLSIGSEFLFEYWGGRSVYFANQGHDDALIGMFWIITSLSLFPAGGLVNLIQGKSIYVLLGSTLFQWTGLMMVLVASPFITMPVLGMGMAMRWASFSPILMERFSQDFGAAFGLTISLSEGVTFILSLMSSILVTQSGSYIKTIILLATLQMVSVISILRYIRQPKHEESLMNQCS